MGACVSQKSNNPLKVRVTEPLKNPCKFSIIKFLLLYLWIKFDSIQREIYLYMLRITKFSKIIYLNKD